jgi:hypothetical protein
MGGVVMPCDFQERWLARPGVSHGGFSTVCSGREASLRGQRITSWERPFQGLDIARWFIRLLLLMGVYGKGRGILGPLRLPTSIFTGDGSLGANARHGPRHLVRMRGPAQWRRLTSSERTRACLPKRSDDVRR